MTHAVANTALFVDERDYAARLTILEDAVRDGLMRCHAFCLMGNHEHLLVSVEENALARAMQRTNRFYAGTFNQRHRRVGRLYRAAYQSVLVESESHMLEL